MKCSCKEAGIGDVEPCALHATWARNLIAAEREVCAKIAEQLEQDYLSPEYATPQPIGSFSERFACRAVADAIRNRKG